jgi:hypothetical protein
MFKRLIVSSLVAAAIPRIMRMIQQQQSRRQPAR